MDKKQPEQDAALQQDKNEPSSDVPEKEAIATNEPAIAEATTADVAASPAENGNNTVASTAAAVAAGEAEAAAGFYNNGYDEAGVDDDPSAPQVEGIEWTAAEFIHHEKTPIWYGALAVGTIVLVVLAFLITRGDKVTLGIIILVAITFGILAARRPQMLVYRIDDEGISIGSKTYHFGEFKSFSVFDEGGFSTISLLPLKRFMPAIGLHYETADETRIVNLLSYYLPLDRRTPDGVDRLMRKIHF